MIEAIKRIKFSYALYNFFHKKELIHNEKIYRQLGLNKKYYSPISSKDFANISREKINELTQKKQQLSIQECDLYKSLDNESQNSLDQFEEKGFSVIKKYLSINQVNQINSEIDALLANKTIKNYGKTETLL